MATWCPSRGYCSSRMISIYFTTFSASIRLWADFKGVEGVGLGHWGSCLQWSYWCLWLFFSLIWLWHWLLYQLWTYNPWITHWTHITCAHTRERYTCFVCTAPTDCFSLHTVCWCPILEHLRCIATQAGYCWCCLLYLPLCRWMCWLGSFTLLVLTRCLAKLLELAYVFRLKFK